MPFDTTALANGEHHLVVSVTDAAGNAATVLDREIRRRQPAAPRRPPPWPLPCASAAAAAGAGQTRPDRGLEAPRGGARMRASRGRHPRAHTLEGTLTAGSTPARPTPAMAATARHA